MIIDAHAHLWDPQAGRVNGKPVVPLTGGKSDFGGELRQMMPPYCWTGEIRLKCSWQIWITRGSADVS